MGERFRGGKELRVMACIRRRLYPLPLALIMLSLVSLLLAACGTVTDNPPGANSGSPENAIGDFNFNVATTANVGQSAQITDPNDNVTLQVSVSHPHFSTAIANQDPNYVALPSDEQFLVVQVTLRNMNTKCTNQQQNIGCYERISTLTSFRLRDAHGRQFPMTSGSSEADMSQWNGVAGVTDGTGLLDGQQFTGNLAFLVPTNDSHYTLYFEPYRMVSGAIAVNLGL
jgi:hypothetical protein